MQDQQRGNNWHSRTSCSIQLQGIIKLLSFFFLCLFNKRRCVWEGSSSPPPSCYKLFVLRRSCFTELSLRKLSQCFPLIFPMDCLLIGIEVACFSRKLWVFNKYVNNTFLSCCLQQHSTCAFPTATVSLLWTHTCFSWKKCTWSQQSCRMKSSYLTGFMVAFHHQLY